MTVTIGRRELLAALGGAAAAWPLAARAQQSTMMRQVSVLMGPAESDPEAQSEVAAFRQGFQKLGWTGRHVRIAYRWAAGDANRVRTLARELVALQPDAIFAVTTPAVAALNRRDSHYSDCVRASGRSSRRRIRKQSGETQRQRHRVHQFRTIIGWKVASTAQGARARYRACHRHVQPRDDPSWRIGFLACRRGCCLIDRHRGEGGTRA